VTADGNGADPPPTLSAARPPTLADVAREAGVSTTTASRVLSNSRAVKESSAAAVLEAAERTGYRPNPLARSLRTRTTQSVGMVVPNLTNPFFAAVAQAVASRLNAEDWHLLIADLEDQPGQEGAQLEWLRSYRVDAVLMTPVSDQIELDLPPLAFPLVQIDRWLDIPGSVVVRTDDDKGVQLLVEHLHGPCARRRLAFVGAEPSSTSARLRVDAFRRYSQSPGPELLGDFSIHWGRRAAHQLIDSGLEIDGLVCANDLIALGAVQVLVARGFKVPEDVAVTGFDDIVFAELSQPALTTIRQPVQGLANAAVDAALALVRGDQVDTGTRVLAPELVVRESAPPTAGGQP
jgi:LacI family transcriptional regulator